ncbi:hypothetical protein [Streptomyces uncialis]|uniref:hypothetical protein n=1 Tax=Streptomyces uncialis TaxID=1048205 RepID=UPI00093E5733|nr:hypothetical protein [Streptomyces uncialis]
MARLSDFLTMPRVVRHLPATAEGLPPDGEIVVDAPDEDLARALDAARRGSWEPAAALLARTRAAADWQLRSDHLTGLVTLALHHVGWLEDWFRDRPADPGAALVRAELAVRRAWEIRTMTGPGTIPREQFEAFRTALADAAPLLRAAAELGPDDPTPWGILLTHARGLGAPREVFEEYLAQGQVRAPHDLALHERALPYLSDKWFGSYAEMFAFTRSAAGSAPEGSPLRGLPLWAVTEYSLEYTVRDGEGPVPRALVQAAVADGVELSARFAAGDPMAAGLRNHLALALFRSARRPTAALETFRLIGTDARALPWTYLGAPRETFIEARRLVRMRVARGTPYFRGAVRVPAVAPAPAGTVAPPQAKAVTLCGAPPEQVVKAVLLTGTTLRLAPAPGGRTYLETAPSVDAADGRGAGRRAVFALGGAVRLARILSRGEQWPVVVAQQEGGSYTLTLVRDGEEIAAHRWRGVADVPGLTAASAVSAAFAETLGVTDPRPLTAVLRDSGAPRRHLADAFAALGLPPLPDGFGERDEPLAAAPGARVVLRRSLLVAVREMLGPERVRGRPGRAGRPGRRPGRGGGGGGGAGPG